ncbi:MAG: hypothetical protein V5783_03650 [Pontiella sp.]
MEEALPVDLSCFSGPYRKQSAACLRARYDAEKPLRNLGRESDQKERDEDNDRDSKNCQRQLAGEDLP